MTARAQPYRIEWPLNAGQVEHIDEMFQILFDDLRNGTLGIDVDQISGVLPVENGGTGLDSLTAGDILYADADDSLTTLGIGSAHHVLQVNTGGTAPEWGLVAFENMSPAASASTLIGRRSGSTGDWEAVTLGAGLSMSAGAELSVSVADISTATFITSTDQTGTLPNSRHLIAGTNITLDTSVAGDITIASTASGLVVGDGYWSPLMTGESLTGDPADSEMVLDADGDAVMVWVTT